METGLTVRTLIALIFTMMVSFGGQAIAAPNDVVSWTPLKADRLVVLKGERRLVLMRGDRVMKVFRVALGRYPKGHISYPNRQDRAQARKLGVSPGGQIMIHGLPTKWSAKDVGHPRLDWTQGCIALTNREIDQVWKMVDDGTTIEIHP